MKINKGQQEAMTQIETIAEQLALICHADRRNFFALQIFGERI